jgi:hypothetical protein
MGMTIGGALVAGLLLAAWPKENPEIVSTSCRPAIEECRPYWMVEMLDVNRASHTDQFSCFYENGITAFLYEKLGRIQIDLKGLSSGRIVGRESESDSTHIFSSCDEATQFLEGIRSWARDRGQSGDLPARRAR